MDNNKNNGMNGVTMHINVMVTTTLIGGYKSINGGDLFGCGLFKLLVNISPLQHSTHVHVEEN